MEHVHATEESGSFGERLRARRELLGLTLEDIGHELKTPSRYFKALEENAYEVFPAKVYAEGFLRKYLTALFMNGGSDRVMREFYVQWEIYEKMRLLPEAPPKYWIRGPYVTSRIFLMGVGTIALLGFIGFSVWQFALFSRDPRIVIESPGLDEALFGPILSLKGSIERESRLTVNGREITIDQSGNFNENIELPAGMSMLEFFVENRFGRTSHAVRNVVIR